MRERKSKKKRTTTRSHIYTHTSGATIHVYLVFLRARYLGKQLHRMYGYWWRLSTGTFNKYMNLSSISEDHYDHEQRPVCMWCFKDSYTQMQRRTLIHEDVFWMVRNEMKWNERQTQILLYLYSSEATPTLLTHQQRWTFLWYDFDC